MLARLKIVENERKRRNNTSSLVSAHGKLCYRANVSFVHGQLICLEKMRPCFAMTSKWRAERAAWGAWEDDGLRFRDVDVQRNLRGISSDTRWNKVGNKMCLGYNSHINIMHIIQLCLIINMCFRLQFCLDVIRYISCMNTAALTSQL